jgi:peroxiredoxin
MFTLPSASGDEVSLESFAGDKNVVLVFYRGFW